MIERDTDINAYDRRIGTALKSAYNWEREHIVRLLLDGGADPYTLQNAGLLLLVASKGCL